MKQEKNSATARKILTGIMVWLIVTFFISPALFSLSIAAGLVAGFFLLRRSLLKKGILEETMVTETDGNGRSRMVKRIVVHNKRVQQALHTEGERQFASGAIAGSWKKAADAVSKVSRDAPEEPEYDPAEYESVRETLLAQDDDQILLNGRPANFKNRKNPFEM